VKTHRGEAKVREFTNTGEKSIKIKTIIILNEETNIIVIYLQIVISEVTTGTSTIKYSNKEKGEMYSCLYVL